MLARDLNTLTRAELKLLERSARRFPVADEDCRKAVDVTVAAMDCHLVRNRLAAVRVLAELERLNQSDRLVRLKELEAQLDADALAAVEAGLAELEASKHSRTAIPAVNAPSQD